MKKVSFTDIKKTGRWVLPAGIAALGFAAIALGQTSNTGHKAAITGTTSTGSHTQNSETPAPTVKPNITVNGTKIPTDKNGSTDVTVPGGKAHVDVSNGRTTVTTNTSGQRGDTSNQQTDNLNINLHTQTSGGRSSGSTHVFGSSSNHSSGNKSSSSNSTSIFSSGSANVNISQ